MSEPSVGAGAEIKTKTPERGPRLVEVPEVQRPKETLLSVPESQGKSESQESQ